MSLKAFHFVFITLAWLLSIGCAWLGWNAWSRQPETPTLWFAICFTALAVAMTFYGVWFVRKARTIII